MMATTTSNSTKVNPVAEQFLRRARLVKDVIIGKDNEANSIPEVQRLFLHSPATNINCLRPVKHIAVEKYDTTCRLARHERTTIRHNS